MMLFEHVKESAEALKASGREAIAEAHAAGVPAYYIDAGGIVRELPDGTRDRFILNANGVEIVEHLHPALRVSRP